MDGVLGEAIDAWLAGRSRDDAVSRLVAYGVPAGIVATPLDIVDSPQAIARDLLWDVPSYTGATTRMVGSPIRIGTNGFAPIGEVPAPGRDTIAVLTELGGLDAGEVDGLLEDGVIEGPRP
jgi:CoA:oxalate CoA-transferase